MDSASASSNSATSTGMNTPEEETPSPSLLETPRVSFKLHALLRKVATLLLLRTTDSLDRPEQTALLALAVCVLLRVDSSKEVAFAGGTSSEGD